MVICCIVHHVHCIFGLECPVGFIKPLKTDSCAVRTWLERDTQQVQVYSINYQYFNSLLCFRMAVNNVVFDILSDKTLKHCVSMCCRCNQGADVSEWWRTHAPGERYQTNHWCDHSGRLVQESFAWVIVDILIINGYV